MGPRIWLGARQAVHDVGKDVDEYDSDDLHHGCIAKAGGAYGRLLRLRHTADAAQGNQRKALRGSGGAIGRAALARGRQFLL